jgi:hypothetical protein
MPKTPPPRANMLIQFLATDLLGIEGSQSTHNKKETNAWIMTSRQHSAILC